MIHFLRYDVYNEKIDMDLLNKSEVIKQYRQSVMSREIVDFFKSVMQKFLELKLRSMAIVYYKNPEFWYG